MVPGAEPAGNTRAAAWLGAYFEKSPDVPPTLRCTGDPVRLAIACNRLAENKFGEERSPAYSWKEWALSTPLVRALIAFIHKQTFLIAKAGYLWSTTSDAPSGVDAGTFTLISCRRLRAVDAATTL